VAIPTLVKLSPAPISKIIGDRSNTERVLIGLDILPSSLLGAAANEGPSAMLNGTLSRGV
jgi:hypothetical protein